MTTEGCVIDDACKRWGVTMDNIKSRKKPRAVVRAREDIAAALRILDWPLQKIGTLMKKDHSAIVLMLRRVAKRGAGNTP